MSTHARGQVRGAGALRTPARAGDHGPGLLARHQGPLFVTPALLAMAALILYPLLYTVWLSFTNERGAFIGLANFDEVTSDSVTQIALRNTVVYVGFSVLFQVLIGTAAAILLNRQFRGRGFVRSVVLIPWVVPAIVAATTWAWMMHTEFGIVNYILVSAGAIEAPVGWLTDRNTVMPALIAVNVWKMFPFVALMVLAGLQSIPETLYEAARVDGANLWQEIRFVMLPQLRLVLISVSLILTIWGFNGITIIYAMTRGGPANRTLITPIQIFRQAFEFVDFNGAAALSVLLFFFLAVLTAIYLRVFRRARED
jgi:multiple sugar transport system permease protein